ncbi:pyridoxamine 5'-phosphate oxidase family protein [Aeromicrobium sp.]|uniref:pyridoxamine 5'-phosphate oxidase family protein n=1 Tax=Aeromicrobium sp. TaxID=1871063 RepID=UPI003D6B0D12
MTADTASDLVAAAMRVLGGTRYGVLATASADGTPWASPVYLAHGDWSDRPPDLWWVSSPDSRHSRLIADNPAVAVTVFDSSVAIGNATAVYAEALAQECDRNLAAGNIGLFSECCVRDGGGKWNLSQVTDGARHRLYRASITTLYVLALEGPDRTIQVWP